MCPAGNSSTVSAPIRRGTPNGNSSRRGSRPRRPPPRKDVARVAPARSPAFPRREHLGGVGPHHRHERRSLRRREHPHSGTARDHRGNVPAVVVVRMGHDHRVQRAVKGTPDVTRRLGPITGPKPGVHEDPCATRLHEHARAADMRIPAERHDPQVQLSGDHNRRRRRIHERPQNPEHLLRPLPHGTSGSSRMRALTSDGRLTHHTPRSTPKAAAGARHGERRPPRPLRKLRGQRPGARRGERPERPPACLREQRPGARRGGRLGCSPLLLWGRRTAVRGW